MGDLTGRAACIRAIYFNEWFKMEFEPAALHFERPRYF
jgi:hypothetical protein